MSSIIGSTERLAQEESAGQRGVMILPGARSRALEARRGEEQQIRDPG
jgi:hypothetical protein